MGDDLGQNWAVDDDVPVDMASDDDDVDIWNDTPRQQEQLAVDQAPVVLVPDASKKRPLPTGLAAAANSAAANSAAANSAAATNRARKPKKRKHSRGARGEQKDMDLSTPSKVSEYIYGTYAAIMEGKLSILEMQDSRPNPNQFHATDSLLHENILQLVQRCITNWEPTLKKAFSSKPSSSTTVLVVSGSSNRACALIKQLSKLKLPCAKLFSRHMKPDQQRDALKKTAFPVGVGTPNRVLKLLDLGYLKLTKTTLVVFDCTVDVKGYNMFTQADTKGDCAVLLQRHLLNNDRLQYVCLTA
jgi:hypothetical protein